MKIRLIEGKNSEFMKPNIEYTVFAVYIARSVEYQIFSEKFNSFPIAVESNDVEITDNRISRYWVFGNSLNGKNIISFPEWANNKMFYQDLVESSNQGNVWRAYQNKMELEFADNTIKLKAKELDSNWVQCAECLDAWKEKSSNEVVVCPSCNAKQINPLCSDQIKS